MTGAEILRAMNNGSTLHNCRFGFFLISPIDSRCTNVHNGAAKALARKGLIGHAGQDQWVAVNQGERDDDGDPRTPSFGVSLGTQ